MSIAPAEDLGTIGLLLARQAQLPRQATHAIRLEEIEALDGVRLHEAQVQHSCAAGVLRFGVAVAERD